MSTPGSFGLRRGQTGQKACWACAFQAMAQQYKEDEAKVASAAGGGRLGAGANPWRSKLGGLVGLTLVCEATAAASRTLGSSDPGGAIWWTILHVPLGVLAVLFAAAAVNAALQGKRKPKTPAKVLNPDPARQLQYGRILSEAIQCQTISRDQVGWRCVRASYCRQSALRPFCHHPPSTTHRSSATALRPLPPPTTHYPPLPTNPVTSSAT